MDLISALGRDEAPPMCFKTEIDVCWNDASFSLAIRYTGKQVKKYLSTQRIEDMRLSRSNKIVFLEGGKLKERTRETGNLRLSEVKGVDHFNAYLSSDVLALILTHLSFNDLLNAICTCKVKSTSFFFFSSYPVLGCVSMFQAPPKCNFQKFWMPKNAGPCQLES